MTGSSIYFATLYWYESTMTQSVNQEQGICFNNVTLVRNGRTVIDQLSLQLSEARIGLIGHNGSGKSSLLRLINGLLPVNAGQISVFGQNPNSGPEKMSSHVGFIFQNPDHQIIFPTVEEELCFGLINQGLPKSKALEKVMTLLSDQGRCDWAKRPIHSLSDGQKQWVCIVSIILMDPKVILLDEPFSALDLPTRYQLLSLLHDLPQQIIMISHELDSFTDFDRIIWLEQGKVRQDGPTDEILKAYYADAKRAQTR